MCLLSHYFRSECKDSKRLYRTFQVGNLQETGCKQAKSASFTDFCGLLELVENMKFGYNRNTNVNKGCKDFISQITKVKRNEVICKLENLNMCV
jgi:hypothetical protein